MTRTFRFAFVLLQIICALRLSSCQRHSEDECVISLGLNGTCTLVEDCPSVQKDLKEGKRPVNCGFIGRNPIVCCPKSVEVLPERAGEKAKKWCSLYIEKCPNVQQIAGGTKVLPERFPHMAAVGYGDGSQISWSCGGSLISEKFILTAAHCLSAARLGQAKWILLGNEELFNSTTYEPKKGQIHPVVRRVRHPGYKPPSKYNDIALLEIGDALTKNAKSTNEKSLHPACLPSKDYIYNRYKAIATGWGRVGHGEEGSSDLLKVQLDIIDNDNCSRLYDVEIKTTKWLEKGLDSSLLCAGILEGGMDTCQGDSGGPLQYETRYECAYEVWGITSFGKICAFENSPALYTRVSEFIPWIESIVWPND